MSYLVHICQFGFSIMVHLTDNQAEAFKKSNKRLDPALTCAVGFKITVSSEGTKERKKESSK